VTSFHVQIPPSRAALEAAHCGLCSGATRVGGKVVVMNFFPPSFLSLSLAKSKCVLLVSFCIKFDLHYSYSYF